MGGRKIGVVLLGVWLVLHGAVVLFGLAFQGLDVVMGVLALAAGVLLLVDR